MDVEYKLEALKKIRQSNDQIGFFVKLCNMTERVKLFNDYFCSRRPYFHKNYVARKSKMRNQEQLSIKAKKLSAGNRMGFRAGISPSIKGGSINLSHLQPAK